MNLKDVYTFHVEYESTECVNKMYTILFLCYKESTKLQPRR